MSKQTAIIDRNFSFIIAESTLLTNEQIKPYLRATSSLHLYTAYIVKVNRKLYTHKYGYTSAIWDRIIGLANDYGLDFIMHIYVFTDEKSARNFEKYIKAYVQNNVHKRGGRTDSFRVKDEITYTKMMDAITTEYLKHKFASVDLMNSVKNYIAACNKFIAISKRRMTKREKKHVPEPFRRVKSQTCSLTCSLAPLAPRCVIRRGFAALRPRLIPGPPRQNDDSAAPVHRVRANTI